jgi:serine-type D-Ala-D-Ala carboxypeptidase/endopeptidase (penicillin-binding protein 4)
MVASRPVRLAPCRAAIAAGVAVAVVAPGAAHAAPPPLRATLSTWAAAHPGTSALVWRLGGAGPEAILAFRPDVARMPASTMKIITSTGALLALGPEFRFETRVYAGVNAVRRGRVLRGPIYLKGYGDPVLSTPIYAKRFLGGEGGNLGRLAGKLRDRGISLVRGPLVADDSFFDARRSGPHWKASYTSECPPLSGLTVNQSTLGDHKGGWAAVPAVSAATRLRGALLALGVRQRGPLRPGHAPSHGRLLATVKSPPLRAILGVMNPNSDNFIAETLVKDVGAYGRGEGTTRAGTRQTSRLLRTHGILGPNDRLVDGSGLSRANRVTASTMVRALAAADADPTWGSALIRSLARGGEGTLRRRLLDPGVRARVRAKTGYIEGVSSLAGVVTSRAGVRYAFAFLMNDWDIGGAHATQDRIVSLLATGGGDGLQPLPA